MSSLMADYKEFCSLRSNLRMTAVLDLSDVNFFHPTTLLPLAALIKEEKPKILQPKNPGVKAYLKTATSSSRFKTNNWNDKSYVPAISLPNQKDKVDGILQNIYKIHNNGKDCGGENAFKYLIGEIVDNIYEHSEFSSSWVLAQVYEARDHMDICFFDNGITINGCFRKHDIGCAKDQEAIVKAISGVSTKGNGRGFGLNTNINMFTSGIQGQILVVSGKGAFQNLVKQQPQSYSLSKAYELTGTIISVRIPYPAPVVNIYEYLE